MDKCLPGFTREEGEAGREEGGEARKGLSEEGRELGYVVESHLFPISRVTLEKRVKGREGEGEREKEGEKGMAIEREGWREE